MSANSSAFSKSHSASPWWEILLVMALSLGISLINPGLKIIGILIPVIYLIVEGRLRHRTWTENGFDLKSFPKGVIANLGWILLVGVGTQALAVFGAFAWLPEYSQHVIARLPIDVSTLSIAVIVAVLISTLGEEIIYRGLFQNRISAFLPVSAAIALSSLIFGLMHYSPGPALVVLVDVALVIVDSVIYGIIFARTRNIFVSWAAHFLADVVGMAFLLMLPK
jgi:membrane protease YdiL (CAAX protease family)